MRSDDAIVVVEAHEFAIATAVSSRGHAAASSDGLRTPIDPPDDHDPRRRAEPPTRRRARDSEIQTLLTLPKGATTIMTERTVHRPLRAWCSYFFARG
jgi:hypothetical protein